MHRSSSAKTDPSHLATRDVTKKMRYALTHMHMKLLCILSLLLLGLASCTDKEQSFEDRMASLADTRFEAGAYWDDFDELTERVRSVVEEQSGQSLSNLKYRIADREQLSEALRNNLSLQSKALGPQLYEVLAQVDSLSYALMGIYDISTGEILIGKPNFPMFAAMFKDDAINTAETLTAVLIHESAHAVADNRWGLEVAMEELESLEEITGYSAVIEGYAQYLARDYAPLLNVEDAFEKFTWMISAIPEDIEGAERLVLQATTANMAFQYYEGEAFVRAIVEASDEDAIGGLFIDPPIGSAIISNPAWYLDPSLVEKSDLDLVAITNLFEEFYAGEGTTPNQSELNDATLRAALAPLSEKEIDAYMSYILGHRVGAIPKGQSGAMTVLILYDTRSTQDAVALIGLSKQLLEMRDDLFKEGPTRIVKSEYTDYSVAGWSGHSAEKTVSAGGAETEVTTLSLHRGAVVVEISFIEVDFEKENLEDYLEQANLVLDADSQD